MILSLSFRYIHTNFTSTGACLEHVD